MFCPVCKSEYRSGFTRCEPCDVDLVDRVEPVEAGVRSSGIGSPPASGPMTDYCGFLSLDEAYAARDLLRVKSIRSEIVIREPADSDLAALPRNEYWLRVPADAYKSAATVLGFDPVQDSGVDEGGSLSCSECGETVGNDEVFCPHCGARFE